MKTSNIINTFRTPKIFTSMVIAIVLSFGLYSFAIASTTVDVADSNVLNSDIQELRTEIAELEGNYYAMVSQMNEEHALTDGFSVDEDVAFARATQETVVAYRN